MPPRLARSSMDDDNLGEAARDSERGFLTGRKRGTLVGARYRPVGRGSLPRGGQPQLQAGRQRGTEMAPSTADRRFSALLDALTRTDQAEDALTLRVVKTAAGRSGTLRIGNVSAPLMVPERPELVPTEFGLLNGEAEDTARHLRWILQYLLR
jgi:hypothetical protein